MKTRRYNKYSLPFISGYANNAILKIVLYSGVAYVTLGIIWAVIRIVFPDDQDFYLHFLPNIGLPPISEFKFRFWTLLTYGWFAGGFWELFSNMLWLYAFGSVVQMLIGYRQVVPIYVYSLFFGGIVCLLVQLSPIFQIPDIFSVFGKPGHIILGSRPGVLGMAVAALTISPKYKFYLADRFGLPLYVIVAIYAFMTILTSGFYLPVLLLLLGGAISGFLYVRLLQAGYRPGDWMYVLSEKVEGIVTPLPKRNTFNLMKKRNRNDTFSFKNQEITQQNVDDILDKINQKGYNSLTSDEKEILKKAAAGK